MVSSKASKLAARNDAAILEAKADPLAVTVAASESEAVARALAPPDIPDPDFEWVPENREAFSAGYFLHVWCVAVDRTKEREIAEALCRALEALDGGDGRTLLAVVVEEMARPLHRRNLILTHGKKGGPKSADPLYLARSPGLLAISGAALEAVAVDGEPFMTREPGVKVGRYRTARTREELFPGPRTLDGEATGGLLFEAAANLALTGDERSPLRADLLRLGTLAFALSGSTRLSDVEGAQIVAGADTPPNRERFNRAIWALRYMRIEARPRIYWALVDAMPGDITRLGPPEWWIGGGPKAFRLSGALFRPASKWGAIERTVAGLEGALTWGPSAGKGRHGRLPLAVRPERKGGPGPAAFVPWWQVLRVAGEPVEAWSSAPPKGSGEWQRYNREVTRFNSRCRSLQATGYFVSGGERGTAPAGDTIEILRRMPGGRGRAAGVWVRFSTRGCAAYASDRVETRIPAAHLVSGA